MKRAMHTGACLLAAGAICTAEQNGFTEYQRVVFSRKLNSPSLNDVKNVARRSGLDVPRFIQCIASPKPWKIVLKQIEESKRHDVHSTPTIFINNKRYKGRVKLEWLQKIVDMELERIAKNDSITK
jgi:protein-disulfide isomerase